MKTIVAFPLRLRAAKLWTMLLVMVSASGWADAQEFRKTLELQGVRFQIRSANAGSQNQLTIQASGRIAKQPRIVKTILGTVAGAEIGDLNADGWPEIYIYVTSAGSGSYGSLVGYAVNKGRSLSGIHLPDLAEDGVHSTGYLGHDAFALVENTLARRFPIYRSGDSNSAPSGGQRQLHYQLHPGEAGWVLRLDPSKTITTP